MDVGIKKVAEVCIKYPEVCNFKRGGLCVNHGCMGVKYTVTESKWCMKKDGTYGYKNLRKTKYKCQFEGVTESNRNYPDPGTVKRTTQT